jgi:biotin carboxyl carrier protein
MKRFARLTAFLYMVLLFACSNGNPKTEAASSTVTTPVTVTVVKNGTIQKQISLLATSAYLKKNTLRSTTSGYITKTYGNLGDFVKAGSPLYVIKTKEAEALANFGKSNPEWEIHGEFTIKAPVSGFILEVDKQYNDYVTDGDPLCVIADKNSLVFLLNVPFEQRKHVVIGQKCDIFLSDSTQLEGTLVSKLSTLDVVSQTQCFVVKAHTSTPLPENLTASIKLTESTQKNTQIVDKSCVLSDETMKNFWVMKLLNDTLAVKVPVRIGIVTDQRIEILSPKFATTDRLVRSGHYGLPDTARILITHP